MEKLGEMIFKKDLIIDGYKIKDVNLKVMGKKIHEMQNFYNKILERMTHKLGEEALLYEKKIEFLTKKLSDYSDLPQNYKTLSNVKTLVSMTQASPGKYSSKAQSGNNRTQLGLSHQRKLLQSYQQFLEAQSKNITQPSPQQRKNRARLLYDAENAHQPFGKNKNASYNGKRVKKLESQNFVNPVEVERFETLESKESYFQHDKNQNQTHQTEFYKKYGHILNRQPEQMKRRTSKVSRSNQKSISVNSSVSNSIKVKKKQRNPRRLLDHARDNSDKVFRSLDRKMSKSQIKAPLVVTSNHQRFTEELPSLPNSRKFDEGNKPTSTQEPTLELQNLDKNNRLILKLNGETIDSQKIFQKFETGKRLEQLKTKKSRAHLSPQKLSQITELEKNFSIFASQFQPEESNKNDTSDGQNGSKNKAASKQSSTVRFNTVNIKKGNSVNEVKLMNRIDEIGESNIQH